MDALGINLPGLITQIVSFIILFVILSKLLYKPLVGMLDQRAEKIKEGLEASERARDDASKAEEAITQQLDEARLEGQKLISQARETAEKFRKDEMEVATSDIENMKLKAEKDIQRERDAAIEDLRKEFADLVITAAEKVVTNSLDEKEHRKLIENVLEESSSLNNREN
ncbi:MAG: F0F1 ATP synthase subunit B [SAR202 cluster bacterium]|nr:F0F1 ATP synthase subunit B [SAR202 cluster bacterium]|tara:strand:+ start:10901 stop:11407 length:507 start_codon:yes stop_codon:yes gene_type:complete